MHLHKLLHPLSTCLKFNNPSIPYIKQRHVKYIKINNINTLRQYIRFKKNQHTNYFTHQLNHIIHQNTKDMVDNHRLFRN